MVYTGSVVYGGGHFSSIHTEVGNAQRVRDGDLFNRVICSDSLLKISQCDAPVLWETTLSLCYVSYKFIVVL